MKTKGIKINPIEFDSRIPSELLKIFDNENNILGSGSFAIVYKGKFLQKDVACKVIHTYQPFSINGTKYKYEAQLEDSLIKELNIYNRVKHKNILKCYGYSLRNKKVCIVSKYMKEGSLCKYLKNNLSEDEKFRLCSEVVCGFNFLHSKKIIHRDIKPSNMLLKDDERHVVICDFGLARDIDISTSPLVGTPLYKAPEVKNIHKQNLKCDIYSIGLVLREIITGLGPSEYKERREEFKGTNREKKIIDDIVLKCLHPENEKRPAMETIFYQFFSMVKNVNEMKIFFPKEVGNKLTNEQFEKYLAMDPKEVFLNVLKSFKKSNNKIFLEAKRKIKSFNEEENKGLYFRKQGFYNKALSEFTDILKILKYFRNESVEERAICNFHIGRTYSKMGDFDEAEMKVFKAKKVLKNFRNDLLCKEILGDCLNELGAIKFEKNKLEAAKINLFESNEIKREIMGKLQKDSDAYRRISLKLADTYNNLGILYFKERNMKNDAKKYNEMSLKIRKRFENCNDGKIGITTSYLGLGQYYVLGGEVSLGLKYFEDADKCSQKILNEIHPLRVSLFNKLGYAYFQKGLEQIIIFSKKKYLQKSINQYKKCIDILERKGCSFTREKKMLEQCKLNLSIVLFEKGKKEEAIKVLKECKYTKEPCPQRLFMKFHNKEKKSRLKKKNLDILFCIKKFYVLWGNKKQTLKK